MDRPADEVLKINGAALHVLFDGNYYCAQQLFRDNAKKNRSFFTLHNLGQYYVEEGIARQVDPEGQRRFATRLGIQYLLKAGAMERSAFNLAAVADAYIAIHEYQNAVRYFEQALATAGNQIADHRFHNNYGAVLYMAGSYESAGRRFHEALGYCGDQDDRFEINVSYAYSLLKTDMEKCRETIKKMLPQLGEYEAQMLVADIFILLCLARDFQPAYAIRASLFGKYSLDSSLIAMVFECLIELGRTDEAEECLHLHIENLRGYEYDTRREIRNARLALESPEFRKKLIASYRYIPQKIKRCYYLGCPKHNPL